MLRRIYVDNFRSLVNFEFKPERVTLLVGKNGTGKSTFFDALKTIDRIVVGTSIQGALPPDSLAWWDVRRQQLFELELEGPAGERFAYRLKVKHIAHQGAVNIEEALSMNEQPLIKFSDGKLVLPNMTTGIPFDGKQSALALGSKIFSYANSLLEAGCWWSTSTSTVGRGSSTSPHSQRGTEHSSRCRELTCECAARAPG